MRDYDKEFLSIFNEYYPFERYIFSTPKSLGMIFDDMLITEIFVPYTEIKPILNDDGSVTFSNEGFAIDVNGGVVSNSNIIQLYERNGTNAQKFFVRHWGNGWFSLHSALNQNYCIDIRQGSSEPFTQIQLYENNGTNAQKFRFVD